MMRFALEIDGEKYNMDPIADSALTVIEMAIDAEKAGITHGFTMSAILLMAAECHERGRLRRGEADANVAGAVRREIERMCEPKSKKRTQHLRLVLSNDSDAPTSPQAGV